MDYKDIDKMTKVELDKELHKTYFGSKPQKKLSKKKYLYRRISFYKIF